MRELKESRRHSDQHNRRESERKRGEMAAEIGAAVTREVEQYKYLDTRNRDKFLNRASRLSAKTKPEQKENASNRNRSGGILKGDKKEKKNKWRNCSQRTGPIPSNRPQAARVVTFCRIAPTPKATCRVPFQSGGSTGKLFPWASCIGTCSSRCWYT